MSHDLGTDDGRRGFLSAMLQVAGRIPDRAARDQFADRVAHRARITEEVVRAEIRRAAVEQRTELTPRELPGFGNVKPAEKGLIWAVVHAPASGLDALASLEDGDLEDLRAGPILLTARSLVGWPTETLPRTLLERLSEKERQLVEEIAGDTVPPATAGDCARAIKRLSYEREQASVQRKIDRLQELGTQGHSAEIDKLWQRKKNLLQEIEALNA